LTRGTSIAARVDFKKRGNPKTTPFGQQMVFTEEEVRGGFEPEGLKGT